MKRHFLWFVEVFVWLLILSLVSGGIMFAKYNYKRVFNTYQLFLPDVDGLINGSPVKFMGIQIGYVNQLDIVGEDVYVKFIVTEPNVKIPYGSIATVEFSGLGGSKSLELYPPKKNSFNNLDKIIIPQSPKRIHDSLGLLNTMFDKLIGITFDVSNFMDKLGIINSKKETIKGEKGISAESANKFINFSDKWLDKMQKQSNKFNNKINKTKEEKNGKDSGNDSGKNE